MKCPHCGISFHEAFDQRYVLHGSLRLPWLIRNTQCPSCNQWTLQLSDALDDQSDERNWKTIFPEGSNRGPVPASVPATISGDYIEACNVLAISAKASAALSRRCLQNILSTHNYVGRDLSRQIDAFINESDPSKIAPSSLRDIVDGIRNFGNFSAHPITDQTTLQIIDVEPHEAEWCLEILEEMFEHFYERPAQAAARKLALNNKLAAGGKPPAK